MVMAGMGIQARGVLSPLLSAYDECVLDPHCRTKAGRTYALADWERLHDQLDIYLRRDTK